MRVVTVRPEASTRCVGSVLRVRASAYSRILVVCAWSVPVSREKYEVIVIASIRESIREGWEGERLSATSTKPPRQGARGQDRCVVK